VHPDLCSCAAVADLPFIKVPFFWLGQISAKIPAAFFFYCNFFFEQMDAIY
jgi:hypothetical protein